MDLKQNQTCVPRRILDIRMCRNIGSMKLLILRTLYITVGDYLKIIKSNSRPSHSSDGFFIWWGGT
jgi:hypothetical protein